MNVSKKLALAAIALSVNSIAFAGAYSPSACTSHAVTIPCEDNAWDIGVEIFDVQGTTNVQNYAAISNEAGTSHSSATVDSDYKFGFELNGSWHFATGNDLTIRWERAHSQNSDSFVANSDTTYIFTTGVNTTSTNIFQVLSVLENSVAKARFEYEFDAINAEFGQHIDVGNDMDMRVHGGLQYARVGYTKLYHFDSGTEGDLVQQRVRADSDFDGVGARVGADAYYHLGNGWNLVGHSAFSLLVGDIQVHNTGANDAGDPGTIRLKEEQNFHNTAVVVPAALLKTGLSYATPCFDGNLSLEGGWRWQGYFNSIDYSQASFVATNEDFTLSGPYLGLSYVS